MMYCRFFTEPFVFTYLKVTSLLISFTKFHVLHSVLRRIGILLLKTRTPFVAFLWNFFISKEAVAAERRYEKERHSVKLHACKLHLVQGRICSLFSLPSPSPPSHPPPINVIREASCIWYKDKFVCCKNPENNVK